ncbi:LysR family transcriptional regulator [Amantichitinum ursilacus]|uniref:HTH-type transcriptional regulator DmlR n=1 Tax=Amantichitinum ursilacus TaxID=857265 RepID=A0A0N0XL08_9NEIS|nr:LysR family transcriptional regulator [Amantichitinum ursilacus]KPC55243.1 HTH-type transcriptional regulator DmlR [Amantichitinum ursilacus]
MDKLQAMAVFVRVVEAGSFVGAADKLGVSSSVVSRLVADLESRLEARLLQRTTRRLALTDAGRIYLARCQQILADIAEAESEIGSNDAEPTGTLRFTAPVSLGTRHLASLLPQFCARYPQVQLDISLADRSVDLVEEGLDLGLRIAAQMPGSYVARKITPIRVVVCAAPGYLMRFGTPTTPEALREHRALTYSYAAEGETWSFTDAQQRRSSVPVRSVMRANNGDVLVAAARAGEGVILQPTFLVGDDLRSGALVPLLQDYHLPALALQAIYPSRRHVSAKVRAFIAFLHSEWGDTPPWDAWLQPPVGNVPPLSR